jgi:hypothetical protein
MIEPLAFWLPRAQGVENRKKSLLVFAQLFLVFFVIFVVFVSAFSRDLTTRTYLNNDPGRRLAGAANFVLACPTAV